MDNLSMYDVLDVGSIWRSKRHGHLHVVLALANFSLPEKYLKTNPPQVVFSDGNQVLSTTVDRFLSLRNYVRQDDSIKDAFYNMASMPITEEEREPSLQLDDDEDSFEESETVKAIERKEELEHEETDNHTLVASAKEQPQAILLTANTAAKDLAAKIANANAKLISYRQLRTIDGIYYHTVSVSSLDYVQLLIDRIYEIDSIEIMINNRVKISINNPQITTAYTEVCNNESVYSITFADASQAEELENEPEEPEDAAESVEANTLQNAFEAKTIPLNVVPEAQGSSISANSSEFVIESNSTLENNVKEPSLNEVSSDTANTAQTNAEEVSTNEEQDNTVEEVISTQGVDLTISQNEIESASDENESTDASITDNSIANLSTELEQDSSDKEHTLDLEETEDDLEEVEELEEEISSNEEEHASDVDEIEEVTLDSNVAIVDDSIDQNEVEETEYSLDHTLAVDEENVSSNNTTITTEDAFELTEDDKLADKLETIIK